MVLISGGQRCRSRCGWSRSVIGDDATKSLEAFYRVCGLSLNKLACTATHVKVTIGSWDSGYWTSVTRSLSWCSRSMTPNWKRSNHWKISPSSELPSKHWLVNDYMMASGIPTTPLLNGNKIQWIPKLIHHKMWHVSTLGSLEKLSRALPCNDDNLLRSGDTWKQCFPPATPTAVDQLDILPNTVWLFPNLSVTFNYWIDAFNWPSSMLDNSYFSCRNLFSSSDYHIPTTEVDDRSVNVEPLPMHSRGRTPSSKWFGSRRTTTLCRGHLSWLNTLAEYSRKSSCSMQYS